FVTMEMKQDRAVIVARHRARLHLVGEFDDIAVANAPGVANERPPAPQPLALVQRRADAGFAPPALELRRNHPGVVEHQHVARPQDAWQIEHAPVRYARALDQQHARRVARARRAESDTIGREAEVEKVDGQYWGFGALWAA